MHSASKTEGLAGVLAGYVTDMLGCWLMIARSGGPQGPKLPSDSWRFGRGAGWMCVPSSLSRHNASLWNPEGPLLGYTDDRPATGQQLGTASVGNGGRL